MEKIKLYSDGKKLLERIDKFQKNKIETVDEMQDFIVDLIVYAKSKLNDNSFEIIQNYERLYEELKKREIENHRTIKNLEKNEQVYEEMIKNLEIELFEKNERIIMLKESIEIKNEKIRKYRLYFEDNYKKK